MIGAITAANLGGGTVEAKPVAGYNLWLDASHAASFTYSSGTVVSQWTDRSANAYTFTQATTANQPTRNTTMNSLSTVQFGAAGATTNLTATAAQSTWKYFHDGTGSTVFFVYRYQTTSGEIGGTKTSNTGIGIQWYPGDATYRLGMESANGTSAQYGGSSTGSGAVNTASIVTTVQDQTNATVAQRLLMYLNTGAANTQTNASMGSPNTGTSTYQFRIGCSPAGLSDRMIGEIAEIITYTSILSTINRDANITYLKAKWGI
jgi:hypothetical protein